MFRNPFKRIKSSPPPATSKALIEWKNNYFPNIEFPIIIFRADDYLGVSDLEEYFYDVDINIWYIDSTCVLVDSIGQKYNFRQIEGRQWVPHIRIGEMGFADLLDQLTPLLYLPSHKEAIAHKDSIKGTIELILTE